MAIEVTHEFVSPVTDLGDPDQVGPDEWNAVHVVTGGGAVDSVNGETGVVVLDAADVGAVPTARTITAGTGLTGGGDLTANRTLAADFGAIAGKVTQGDDARLSDARAPTGNAGGDLSGTYPNPSVADDSHAHTSATAPGADEVTGGTATIDFGAFPGTGETSLAITGQTAIVSGSLVSAWIRPVDTADHSSDEHLVETLRVMAADIVAGTGFTIYGFDTCAFDSRLWGTWSVAWAWV